MNIIGFSNGSKSKKIFKGLLCPFSITIDIEVVGIITIVDMTKIVFCSGMLVIINDPLPLLILI